MRLPFRPERSPLYFPQSTSSWMHGRNLLSQSQHPSLNCSPEDQPPTTPETPERTGYRMGHNIQMGSDTNYHLETNISYSTAATCSNVSTEAGQTTTTSFPPLQMQPDYQKSADSALMPPPPVPMSRVAGWPITSQETYVYVPKKRRYDQVTQHDSPRAYGASPTLSTSQQKEWYSILPAQRSLHAKNTLATHLCEHGLISKPESSVQLEITSTAQKRGFGQISGEKPFTQSGIASETNLASACYSATQVWDGNNSQQQWFPLDRAMSQPHAACWLPNTLNTPSTQFIDGVQSIPLKSVDGAGWTVSSSYANFPSAQQTEDINSYSGNMADQIDLASTQVWGGDLQCSSYTPFSNPFQLPQEHLQPDPSITQNSALRADLTAATGPSPPIRTSMGTFPEVSAALAPGLPPRSFSGWSFRQVPTPMDAALAMTAGLWNSDRSSRSRPQSNKTSQNTSLSQQFSSSRTSRQATADNSSPVLTPSLSSVSSKNEFRLSSKPSAQLTLTSMNQSGLCPPDAPSSKPTTSSVVSTSATFPTSPLGKDEPDEPPIRITRPRTTWSSYGNSLSENYTTDHLAEFDFDSFLIPEADQAYEESRVYHVSLAVPN